MEPKSDRQNEPISGRLDEVFPGKRSLSVDESLGELAPESLAPVDRPYVVLNMSSTADGKATIQGRSGEIGNEVDRALFSRLRTRVNAVMVGAGTLRTERYGRLVRDPALVAEREQRGLRPQPLCVIVSGSFSVSAGAPIFEDPESEVVIFTSTKEHLGETVTVGEASLAEMAAQVAVEWVAGDEVGVAEDRVRVAGDERYATGDERLVARDGMRLAEVLRRLRDRYKVQSLLVEGGPALNRSLLEERLVDEIFLTFAPKLVGGSDAPTIVAGRPLTEGLDLDLVWVRRQDSYLFLRYRVLAAAPNFHQQSTR